MKRITVHFTGTVQGVGFRYTTCRVAERFSVTGLVRNLPDGGVELVAEGEDAEVDKFLHAVQQAMAGYLRETQVAESPGTNEYSTFSVAF